jgi:hypothetical protein
VAELGCSRVIISGRNEEHAEEVLKKMNEASTLRRSEGGYEGKFVKGDLTLVFDLS